MSSARETILAHVRQALEHPSHVPDTAADITRRVREGLEKLSPPDPGGLAEQFKKEVETVSGECHLCADDAAAKAKLLQLFQAAGLQQIASDGHGLSRTYGDHLVQQMPGTAHIDPASLNYEERRRQIAVMPAGLVEADYGIADTGSLVILYSCEASGLSHVLPETIFALLPIDRLLPNLYSVTDQVPLEKRKNMVLITGPSRTADIEKILILGAHGPKRLVVLIVGV